MCPIPQDPSQNLQKRKDELKAAHEQFKLKTASGQQRCRPLIAHGEWWPLYDPYGDQDQIKAMMAACKASRPADPTPTPPCTYLNDPERTAKFKKTPSDLTRSF